MILVQMLYVEDLLGNRVMGDGGAAEGEKRGERRTGDGGDV